MVSNNVQSLWHEMMGWVTFAVGRSRSAGVDQPDQGNGCSSCDSAHETHLYSSLDACDDVVAPGPAAHYTCLDVSEGQKRDCHDSDAHVQCHYHLVDDEVWDERDETTDEVAKGECDGGDPRLVAVRLGFLVMKADQEVEEAVFRGVEGHVNLVDDIFGETVGSEDGLDNGTGFGWRCVDEFFCLTNGGLVRFTICC